MLLEIQGENTGSFMMFGSVATQLLKMMGQSGETEGAIREEDVPTALENLRNALDKLPVQKNTSDDDDEGTDTIGLHTRAKPLIDLLEESVQKGGYVMWKPQ